MSTSSYSSDTGEAAHLSLALLPVELLAHVLGFLPPHTAVLCATMCSALHAALQLPEAWRYTATRLDCDLKASGRGGRPEWLRVWRAVVGSPSEGPLRFKGLFTDGGCDEGGMQFWVDNMFVPNHWESYCSSLSTNVTAIGVLTGGLVKADVAEASHREFIIDRCRLPVMVIYGNAPHAANSATRRQSPRLEAWSSQELEMFFLMIHDLLQEGHPMGRLLLVGVTTRDVAPTLAKLSSVCATLTKRHDSKRRYIMSAEDSPHAMLDAAALLEVGPLLPLPLLHPPAGQDSKPAGDREMPTDIDEELAEAEDNVSDSKADASASASSVPWAEAGGIHHVGIVERLFVSRAGHFSCPMRAGVIFLGDWRAATAALERTTTAPECNSASLEPSAAMTRLRAVTVEAACAAFDGASSRGAIAALEQAALEQRIPRPVAVGASAAGEWLEFDPKWRPSPGRACGDALRPVVWLRFFSFEEAAVAARLITHGGCLRTLLPRGQRLDAIPWPTDTRSALQGAATPVLGCIGTAGMGSGCHISTPAGATAAGHTHAAAACQTAVGLSDGQEGGVDVEGGCRSANVTGGLEKDDSGDLASHCHSYTLPLVDPTAAAAAGSGGPASLGWHHSCTEGSCEEGGSCTRNDHVHSNTGNSDGSCEEVGGHWEGSDGGFQLADFESSGYGSEGFGFSGSDDDDEAMNDGDPQEGEGDEEGGPPTTRDHRSSTDGRNRLDIRLSRRHCGSLAAVKLVEGEDLRAAHHDHHPDTNIDIAAVAFRGRCVPLPPTVGLV